MVELRLRMKRQARWPTVGGWKTRTHNIQTGTLLGSFAQSSLTRFGRAEKSLKLRSCSPDHPERVFKLTDRKDNSLALPSTHPRNRTQTHSRKVRFQTNWPSPKLNCRMKWRFSQFAGLLDTQFVSRKLSRSITREAMRKALC